MGLKLSKVGEKYTEKVDYGTISDALHLCHYISRKDSFSSNDFQKRSLVCLFNIKNASAEDRENLTIDRIATEVVMGSLIGGQFIRGNYTAPIFGGLVQGGTWKDSSEVGIHFKNFEKDYEISLVNFQPIEIAKLSENYVAQKITTPDKYNLYNLFKLLSVEQRRYLEIKKRVSYTLRDLVGEASED